MVLNKSKCHSVNFGKNTKNETFVFKNKSNEKQWETKKIIGIIIDNKLIFKGQVKN